MSSSAVPLAPARRRAAPQPPGGHSTSGEPTYDELKLKYMTVDRNYENLKRLTRKGLCWLSFVCTESIIITGSSYNVRI